VSIAASLVLLLAAMVPVQSATSAPPDALVALASKAKIQEPIAQWCAAEFQAGQRGAFAAAVTSPTGGRYLALDTDGRVAVLASFTGRPDLSCYTTTEVATLNRSIRESATISGQVTPRWSTTVVCGFVENTSAECWQFSPVARLFMKVGGWTT
jgi:hypothetical protein